MQLRLLTADEVQFNLQIHDEDLPLKGNVMASGDDELDERVVKETQAELDKGNRWAWCCVVVTAKWKSWTGTAVCGCISYFDHTNEEGVVLDGEAQFNDDGEYDCMKKEALEALNEEVQAAFVELQKLQGLEGES